MTVFHCLDHKVDREACHHGIVLSRKMTPKPDLERVQMKKIPYDSAVGSIMYSMICSRPDVAYVLGAVSRHQTDQ